MPRGRSVLSGVCLLFHQQRIKIGGPPGSLTPLPAFVALCIIRYTSSPQNAITARTKPLRFRLLRAEYRGESWRTRWESNPHWYGLERR
jgi:hypothetical protein